MVPVTEHDRDHQQDEVCHQIEVQIEEHHPQDVAPHQIEKHHPQDEVFHQVDMAQQEVHIEQHHPQDEVFHQVDMAQQEVHVEQHHPLGDPLLLAVLAE
jgi:hypothetical protein